MTKDEIKKALEFCAQDNYYFCGGCSYDDVRNCNDKLKTDALNVIIEQEREIERLKADANKGCDSCETVKQAQIDTINTIVKYCENPNHWRELKDCKLFGGKSDDLQNFLNGIFKGIKEQ